METRIFLLADFANIDASSKLNIIGAFNVIWVRSFPATHPSMHLVGKVTAELGEFGTQRNYKVLLLDQDANEMGKLEGKFAFPHPKEGSGGYSEWNLVVGLLQLTFPRAGRYEFRLLVDEHVLGVVSLDVIYKPEPEPTQAQE